MENWENLCGENSWEGLLEPLDDDLRRLIIHYGEMVEATYNAYDSNDNSTTGCKYNKENLFFEVGLGKGFTKKEYIITKYIYATASFTPFDKDTNWMGYVAVATDERTKKLGRRDIVVAWRGTKELSEWSKNMMALKKPASKIFGDHKFRSFISSKLIDHPHLSYIWKKVSPSPFSSFPNKRVHMGFYQIYTTENKNSTFCKTSARYQVLKEVSNLVKKYKNETHVRVIVTGHSLGGALTILNAVDIAINVPLQPNVTAFPFGCPQVGGSDLCDLVANNIPNLRILRIENKPDVVPDLLRVEHALENIFGDIYDIIDDLWIAKLLDIKPDLLNHISYYKDVGKCLLLDTAKSDYLKRVGLTIKARVRRAHDMEVYLHGVSGTEGRTNDSFKKNVERNIALVNKHGDYLKDSYGIPTSWWNEPDRANMVQNQNGWWEFIRLQ